MSLVGVDIGSTAVRVVQVEGLDSEGFAVVSKVGISPLKDGAVLGGRIRNPVLVGSALKRALHEAGVRRYGFILGLSSPDTAVARLQLPDSVRPEEREAAIRNLGLEISPTVPLEDSAISTQLVRSDSTPEGHRVNTLLTAAALKSEVESLRAVCRLAGAQPRAIDMTGAALLRSLVRTDPEADEIATVVDIGATKTTIATRQGPHLRSIRSATGGGMDITRAIVSVTGESVTDAERRKASMRITNAPRPNLMEAHNAYLDEEPDADNTRQSAVEEALSLAVELLVDQVASSIENDGAMYNSFTQGVSLAGGSALLRGLKERLAQRIGVPVQIGRPWAVIQKTKRNSPFFVEGVEDPRVMLALAPAIGLALWKDPS